MKRIAFYGGSFDPLHNGHLTIARRLTEIFDLNAFVFIPAFHAPHKKDKNPTSAFHRYAMLALATNDEPNIEISRMELDVPARPYTFETLLRLKNELKDTRIFFVMGADSWQDITTWREWETVLTLVNIIVVTRPGYEIGFSHITEEIKARILDLRNNYELRELKKVTGNLQIYITDVVQMNVSATEIRRKIKINATDWRKDVPVEVAKYIEKYELYK
ncbi:MAG TPA: nicotinate-nucleotide adenylyltransferase [Pyrinomonadaceae bacterium]